MNISNITNSLAKRCPLLGPILWIAAVQFFIVQAITAMAWTAPLYSWRLNAISDLGAINCGSFDDRMICSPLSGVMNTSFIVLGLCMTIGAILLYQTYRRSIVGFWLMGLAGIGAILVGIFPEDTVYWAHIVGQDLAFVFGNIALIVFGFTLGFPRLFRWFSIASGTVALVALVLFLSHQRFFLELGGMERLVAYPLLIWLIVTGGYIAIRLHRDHSLKPKKSEA
jgi:hypothetical membrane protein